MKILYITCDYPQYAGVNKKVDAQIKAFCKLGIAAKLVKMPPLSRLLRILPFQSSSIDWESIQVPQETQGIYIRYQLSDKKFIQFLRRVKKEHPSLKLIVEIPTYPYDRELKIFITKWRDQYYRQYLKGLVDRIVTFSDDKSIFGVDTIKAKNGIDLEKNQKRKYQPAQRQDIIQLFCAAYFEQWHGLDRLLYGMIRYYEQEGNAKSYFIWQGRGRQFLSSKQLQAAHILMEELSFMVILGLTDWTGYIIPVR